MKKTNETNENIIIGEMPDLKTIGSRNTIVNLSGSDINALFKSDKPIAIGYGAQAIGIIIEEGESK